KNVPHPLNVYPKTAPGLKQKAIRRDDLRSPRNPDRERNRANKPCQLSSSKELQMVANISRVAMKEKASRVDESVAGLDTVDEETKDFGGGGGLEKKKKRTEDENRKCLQMREKMRSICVNPSHRQAAATS